jgi:division protein CdvB (Snf7/Vps24/ESCRT-III family)
LSSLVISLVEGVLPAFNMSKFTKQWKTQEKEGFGKRTREAIRGPKPVRPQIQRAAQQLNGEINRLENTTNKLRTRENSIFKKTVAAVQAHDQESSKAYSNELAEVRKMTKVVTQSKLALESVTARLETVKDMGDFAVTIAPAIGVVKRVKSTLAEAMPDAQGALGEIGNQLTSIMSDVGGIAETNFYSSESSEEANKILAEAAAIAEKRVNESLPQVPTAAGLSIFDSN